MKAISLAIVLIAFQSYSYGNEDITPTNGLIPLTESELKAVDAQIDAPEELQGQIHQSGSTHISPQKISTLIEREHSSAISVAKWYSRVQERMR
ncbi:hypothetical protein [Litoribrevibacter albus]|uniref:Uncharacterized protein n=1 Tax=Litoribrevibacter albus TaxID=1473156 RepID=A0AA37SDX7_9GAMM|nr:hypothetical protein [Litoribrevibacter albus]GLQ32736.1 hypothetical protein GCM10007876_32150 [Litoribrevibacter albus]